MSEIIETIQISDSAIEYLAGLIAKKAPQEYNVRIFISDPGTPTAETCLAYCKVNEQEETDIQIDLGKYNAFVEARSLPYLKDAQIDYITDDVGGELTIRAPNARLPQVSADSPLEDRVNYVLWDEINPMLASHGGQVQLVEMAETSEGLMAVLQFGGGCQGCGMVDYTLKEGIEKTLKGHFPQIAGVRDLTDHTQKENAYYQ